MTRPYRRLETFVSGQIARTDPFEGGGDKEAWESGSGVRSNTWGGYVSDLGERLGLEQHPGVDGLLALLHIDRTKFADPRVQFTGRSAQELFSDYRYGFIREETDKQAKPVRQQARLVMQAAANALHGFGVSPQDAQEAIQTVGRERQTAHNFLRQKPNVTDKEWEAVMTGDELARLQVHSLRSGLAAPLPDFTASLLGIDPIAEDRSQSPLAYTYTRAIRKTIKAVRQDHNLPKSTPARDVVVGQSELYAVGNYLDAEISKSAREVAKTRWAVVAPIFAPNFDNTGLLARDDFYL